MNLQKLRDMPEIKMHMSQRADADGQVYFAYFVDGVSFSWSGDYRKPINVCPDGANDIVRDVIFWDLPLVQLFGLELTPGIKAHKERFMNMCLSYLGEE